MDDAGAFRRSLAQREENLARRIKYEMNRRGWSQERMAAEMTKAGLPMHQSAISKIINPNERGKRRTISVDEALAFSRVFDAPLDELLSPVAVAKSRELKRVLQEIADLSDSWGEIQTRINILWKRMADLMSAEGVIDTYADQLMHEGMTRVGAIRSIKDWIDEAEARYATAAMKAKAHELGIEYREFAERQQAVIREALEILENQDGYDGDQIDVWIKRNQDVLAGFWLADTVLKGVARLKRDLEEPYENVERLRTMDEQKIQETVKWLKTIDESLTREMERGGPTHNIGSGFWDPDETP
jgi:transcriptional regulator with XRE-family HTH domain